MVASLIKVVASLILRSQHWSPVIGMVIESLETSRSLIVFTEPINTIKRVAHMKFANYLKFKEV